MYFTGLLTESPDDDYRRLWRQRDVAPRNAHAASQWGRQRTPPCLYSTSTTNTTDMKKRIKRMERSPAMQRWPNGRRFSTIPLFLTLCDEATKFNIIFERGILGKEERIEIQDPLFSQLKSQLLKSSRKKKASFFHYYLFWH